MDRRNFIQKSAMLGAMFASGSLPLSAHASKDLVKLTILHTNDLHSRIDPFPQDGSRYAGLGGSPRLAHMISEIRKAEKNVLLFDSGDIFQGTPYFNFFDGELEFKLMSEMGYDAATLGNHDFDAGMGGLVRQLPHADFPFVNSNYGFEDTVMNDHYQTHEIFEVEGVRIGLFGLGIELDGLVASSLYGDTRYFDPVTSGQAIASRLRHDEQCDYVICLSHLGYRYRGNKISDVGLASVTRDIDLVLGGHTHTFMDEPVIISNLDDQPVYINQAGWAGLRLGRVDLFFEKEGNRQTCFSCNNLWVGH